MDASLGPIRTSTGTLLVPVSPGGLLGQCSGFLGCVGGTPRQHTEHLGGEGPPVLEEPEEAVWSGSRSTLSLLFHSVPETEDPSLGTVWDTQPRQ